jgi:predicted nucleic acid-binding protein
LPKSDVIVRSDRIYMDVCVLCRPFDDPVSLRVRMERDAVLLIEEYVRKGVYRMVIAPVHFLELEATAEMVEKVDVLTFLNAYGEELPWNMPEIRERAEELRKTGFGVADAIHVAFAERSDATFLTCDDRLEKKCGKAGIGVACVNPLRFCEEEGLR